MASVRTSTRSFQIDLARADEGVWTATSAAIPGLNVEGDTMEEAVAEARQWAPELLRANGIVTSDEAVRLSFARQGKPLPID